MSKEIDAFKKRMQSKYSITGTNVNSEISHLDKQLRKIRVYNFKDGEYKWFYDRMKHRASGRIYTETYVINKFKKATGVYEIENYWVVTEMINMFFNRS